MVDPTGVVAKSEDYIGPSFPPQMKRLRRKQPVPTGEPMAEQEVTGGAAE
jgi:hypothetical protein